MNPFDKKRGIILNISLKSLGGLTLFALCEKLAWLLPGSLKIDVDGVWVENGCLRLRFTDWEGTSCLPVVPDGEWFPVIDLYPDPKD